YSSWSICGDVSYEEPRRLAPGTSTRTTMPGSHHLAVHAEKLQLLLNLRRCLLRGTQAACPWYVNSNYPARQSSSCCPCRETTALAQSAEMSVMRNPGGLPLVRQLELPCQAVIILLSMQRNYSSCSICGDVCYEEPRRLAPGTSTRTTLPGSHYLAVHAEKLQLLLNLRRCLL